MASVDRSSGVLAGNFLHRDVYVCHDHRRKATAGWTRKHTVKAARKGWLGLISYIEPNGDIRNVCQGTGKKNDLQYYLDRQRFTGDLHGQAPILWCASAFLR